jgi:hypothetical protein
VERLWPSNSLGSSTSRDIDRSIAELPSRCALVALLARSAGLLCRRARCYVHPGAVQVCAYGSNRRNDSCVVRHDQYTNVANCPAESFLPSSLLRSCQRGLRTQCG